MNPTTAHTSTAIEYAVATRALHGHTFSGDGHVVQPFANGVLLAVVDGVGHGKDATMAARAAANVLETFAGESVIQLVQRCHDALRELRGVAMTVVSIQSTNDSFEWLGVGNVEGCCFRQSMPGGKLFEGVMLRGGIVGYQLPPLRASIATISRGDVFVLATDGIRPDFSSSVNLRESVERIANCILAMHFRGTDDGLVLVARYMGGEHE